MAGVACVDAKDRIPVKERPVDCAYQGGRTLYLYEGVGCGPFEPGGQVEATYFDLPGRGPDYMADNSPFGRDPLPRRSGIRGASGGPGRFGSFSVETAVVAGLPPHSG